MSTLKTFWAIVDGKYGAMLAGIVVVAVVGIAWYLGYTPGQVIDWLGR